MMYSQKNQYGNPAILMLLIIGLLISTAAVAQTQGNGSENSATAPSNGAASNTTSNPDIAKASSQPTPDTSTPRVPAVSKDTYVIGAEDVLTISVWKEPDMSKTVPVRPDGMITLPLIGDIKAVGYTPEQLQDQLTTAMKKLISDPQVTVIVTEVHSQSFNVVGQVNKPGYYPLTRRLTILDAIALAGGFKDFAKTKKVYVLRTDANGTEQKLPFNYKQVIKGENPQQNIELQPRDTLVVP